jgi:serine/threonine protein kinase
VQGLKDLFDNDLVHRDLKLANILLHFPIDPNSKLKIGDNEYSEMELISMD